MHYIPRKTEEEMRNRFEFGLAWRLGLGLLVAFLFGALCAHGQTNRVTQTKVPLAEAGSFGYQWDCPHVPGESWLIQHHIADMHDVWFQSFNAHDTPTNATSYTPCVTRGGAASPTGRAVPVILSRAVQVSAQQLAEQGDAREFWRAVLEDYGEDPNDWGLSGTGQLVQIR